MGRLLGYGTVEMSAAGTGTSEARFDRVSRPMDVMAAIDGSVSNKASTAGGE